MAAPWVCRKTQVLLGPSGPVAFWKALKELLSATLPHSHQRRKQGLSCWWWSYLLPQVRRSRSKLRSPPDRRGPSLGKRPPRPPGSPSDGPPCFLGHGAWLQTSCSHQSHLLVIQVWWIAEKRFISSSPMRLPQALSTAVLSGGGPRGTALVHLLWMLQILSANEVFLFFSLMYYWMPSAM